MKYIVKKDGEGFVVKNKSVHRIACCDCGLVHDFAFAYSKGWIGIAAKRNERATAQRRRLRVEQIKKTKNSKTKKAKQSNVKAWKKSKAKAQIKNRKDRASV